MSNLKKHLHLTVIMLSISSVTHSESTVSIQTQDQFFNSIKALCGKAFEGKVTSTNPSDDSIKNEKMTMHVRRCTDDRLEIPFHIGENASRTWIIQKTGSGLSLKHDHRHKDGSSDQSTMYGGHTIDSGWPKVQSFPADQYSKELFIQTQIPQSIDNTWQMFIYPKVFTYRLIRPAREFRVDFDLTKTVTPPPAPWGYSD